MALRPGQSGRAASSRLAAVQRVQQNLNKPLVQPIGSNNPIAARPVQPRPMMPPQALPAPGPMPQPGLPPGVQIRGGPALPRPNIPFQAKPPRPGAVPPPSPPPQAQPVPQPAPTPTPFGGMTPGQALGGEMTMGFLPNPTIAPTSDLIAYDQYFNQQYNGKNYSQIRPAWDALSAEQKQSYYTQSLQAPGGMMNQYPMPPINMMAPEQIYSQYSQAMPTPQFGQPGATPMNPGQTFSTGWNGTGIG